MKASAIVSVRLEQKKKLKVALRKVASSKSFFTSRENYNKIFNDEERNLTPIEIHSLFERETSSTNNIYFK